MLHVGEVFGPLGKVPEKEWVSTSLGLEIVEIVREAAQCRI